MNRLMKNVATWTLFCLSLLAGLQVSAVETVVYYHNDILGSPVAATDADGAVIWREAYEPYGKRIHGAGAGDDLWYTGKPEETEFGLAYMGGRWYSAEIGRFLSVDPAGFDAGNVHSFNRYIYANNNPYRYTDPDGETPIDVAFLAIDVVRLGVALYTGAGVSAAAVDVGLSALGVVSPVPAAGQALKTSKLLSAFRKADAAGDVTRKVTKGAADRAKQVHSVLDSRAQRARTTAVTETKEGIRVISSSERRLTPAQRAQLVRNEIEGVGVGHAEVTGVNAARGAGLTPTGTAASRPICPNCTGFLKDQGVNPLSPLK